MYTIFRIHLDYEMLSFGSFNTIVSWFHFCCVFGVSEFSVRIRPFSHGKMAKRKRKENYIHCITLHMHEHSSNNQCGICILYVVSKFSPVRLYADFISNIYFSHHQHCIPIYSRWTLSNVMSGVELSLSFSLSISPRLIWYKYIYSKVKQSVPWFYFDVHLFCCRNVI